MSACPGVGAFGSPGASHAQESSAKRLQFHTFMSFSWITGGCVLACLAGGGPKEQGMAHRGQDATHMCLWGLEQALKNVWRATSSQPPATLQVRPAKDRL